MANWQECNTWDMKDICPLVDDDLFSNPMFFDDLEFMDAYTRPTLHDLSEKYQVIICSIGTFDNIALKAQWIKENLSFIRDATFIVNDGCKMNKSIINMQNSIFIDDVVSNLESSNAEYKLCFGRLYPWNNTWKTNRALNWSDIYTLLLNFVN